MTIEEHLKTVYTWYPPDHITNFFDELVTDENACRAAYEEIIASAERHREKYQKVAEHLTEIDKKIAMTQQEIEAINATIGSNDYLDWTPELLSQPLQKRQALEFIIGRAAQEIAGLKANPDFDEARALAWAVLRSFAEQRFKRLEALWQDSEYQRAEAMTIKELLRLIFTGADITLYSGARLSFTAMVASFERGGIGGELRRLIYESRQRYGGQADRLKRFACTRLLARAERIEPTPVGWPKYV
jgi:hypothetical protein